MISGVDTTFLVQLELSEAPEHSAAQRFLHSQILEKKIQVALAPQVLIEFIHVVTDPKRFERPLSMLEALKKANLWWMSAEVRQVTLPGDGFLMVLNWLTSFGLGRKRLLDTQLAVTYHLAGVSSIITSNTSDFEIFEVFELIDPVDYSSKRSGKKKKGR